MEEEQRLLGKYGFFITILMMIAVISSVIFGKKDSEERTDAGWESTVIGEEPVNEAENEVTDKEESEGWRDETESEGMSDDAKNEVTEEMKEQTDSFDILTPEEEQNLQKEAMAAVEQCSDFYKSARISGLQSGYTYIEDFSDEQRRGVVKCLGAQGVVSVSEDMNMENYRRMEEFYSGYLSGRDAMITVFSVYSDGNISAKTFVHRKEKLQSYYVSIGWQEGGIPEVEDFGVSDLEEIKLTEKGYFIYTYAETVMHGNLREYYRVRPLSDECRALTEKYITGLSYVNYNMLTTDWDAGNVEEILVPVMFEDIYRIYTGEFPEPENGMIPAEVYERIMTTCFPVSTEQIRECCGYLAETDSYAYEMIFPRQFPPFGEVVEYIWNEDGTITLYVDGVWPDYNSDCAFINQIVVQPFADGTFRYLSNSIEQKELEIPIFM